MGPAHTSKDGLHRQPASSCTSGACLPNSAPEAGCADGNVQRAPAGPHASACVTTMPYGSSSGSDVLAEATPPVCRSEVASPGPPAPGGAGNTAAQDADCGGSCGTEEEIEGEADCASADLTQDDTTTSSTTATDATSADGSLSESEPLTPTTPPQLSVPLLPPAEDPNRMTLVLDLDGTLIASEDEPHAPVPFDYCVDEERFVWLRPGLRRFLESVRPMFEVVLFTAAGESWATCAMQRIDPDGRIFDTRLYRDHTVSHDDWPWVKDLSRLGRDLARVVIVDDNPLMFMYQPDNALHVAPYDPQVTGHRDDVLEQVLDVLMHKVLPADDVREVLKHMKDPISPSCVSSRRHVAAKATPGASGMAALKSFLRMNQAVDSSSTGCSSSSTQQAAGASSRHRGGASQGDSAAPRGAEWQTGAGPAGQPGSSRRGRRSRRGGKDGQAQSQHLPQHQQSLSLGMQVQDQGQQATAGGRGGRRKRRSRSQRQAAKVDDTAAAAQALAAQSQAQKQAQNASRRAVVVAQKTASTALQQPDKQLHLKLRLLQLQREQEAQEASVELPGADAAAPCAGGAGAAALASAPLGVRVCAALAAIAKDEDEDNVLEGTIRGGRTVVGRVPVVQGLAASSEPNGAVAEPQQEATAPAPQAARQARQPPMATPLPMPSAWGRPPHRPWGVAPSAAPSAAGSPERSTALSSSVGGAPIAGAAAPGSALPLNYAAVVSAGRSTGHSAQVSVQAAVCTTSVRACSAMDAPAGVDSSAGCDEVSSPRRRSRGRRGRRGRKTPAGADSEEAAEQLSA